MHLPQNYKNRRRSEPRLLGSAEEAVDTGVQFDKQHIEMRQAGINIPKHPPN